MEEIINGKNYKKFTKSITSNKEISTLERYCRSIEIDEGLIYEYDIVCELISEMVNELKKANGEKKTVLIIDDLDRIDPAHIFRILNVFASHFEHDSNSNKFHFDKIIFVCDNENIRNIFQHFYGEKVDYKGYIEKFYSKSIFNIDNGEILKSLINGFIEKIQIKNPKGNFIDAELKNRIISNMRIFPTLVTVLIQNKVLITRNLFKREYVVIYL